MNRFFDFSSHQIKALAVLSVSAILMSGYLFLHAYAIPVDNSQSLPVFPGDNNPAVSAVFVLDPNTAPADSLELLPGVGLVLADRIIEYRQEHTFYQPIDITNVNGIGPRLYEKIKPYIKISKI